ncbi:MAG: hypothetical protein HY791_21185 [Deltaproteobacteria bacterium]|nr:hypothetical protein [Deltaproteobacteria bacterium]
MKQWVVFLCVAVAAPPALGWDSIAVQPKGSGSIDFFGGDSPICTEIQLRTPDATSFSPFIYCLEGPETARCVFGGEHAMVTSAVFRDLGLSEYAETNEWPLRAWSGNAKVGDGSMDSVMPVPFTTPMSDKVVRDRVLSVTGFSELPDFGVSLADWSAGFERCAIQGIPRETEVDNLHCHQFSHTLGPVNSNHFPPQARRVFEHYHALAKELIQECARLRTRSTDWPHASKSRAAMDEVLEECEMHALILESIGLHYLEDLFSSGHMWERWGSPSISDPTHRDYFAVGLLSGVIHGWRYVIEGAFGKDPATHPSQPIPLASHALDFLVQDPICAPILGASGYRVVGSADSDTEHRGVGDEYLAPCLQYFPEPLPTLFSAAGKGSPEFSETFEAQSRCVAAAVREVYELGPKTKGDLDTPPYLQPGDEALLATDFCFERRATNLTMFRGLGLGSEALLPSDTSRLELVVDASSWLADAFGYDDVASGAAVWRDTVLRIHGAFYLNQHKSQSGLESAALAFPQSAVFGLERNREYESESVPVHADAASVSSWNHADLGGCATDGDCGEAVCNPTTGLCEVKEAATLRLFNRAHATHWCETTTLDDLRTLEQDCKADETYCELCVELVRRQVRNGCDETDWHQMSEEHRVEGLCAITGDSSPFLYAGWLEDCDSFPSVEAAADRWCRKSFEDLAPEANHVAVSPGGLMPAPLRPGEQLTLQTRLTFSNGAPIPNTRLRFKIVDDQSASSACTGSGWSVVTTDADGLAPFPYLAPMSPRLDRVLACLSSPDGSDECDRCNPKTLTFFVRTVTSDQAVLQKVSGDGQTGSPGQLLTLPLLVEVVPPAPDGTELEFALLDDQLATASRGSLDSPGQHTVVKPTTGSRAQARLTLPTVAGSYRVRVRGLDAALFPDPEASEIEFQAMAIVPRGDLVFSLRHNGASVSPIDLEVRVDDGTTIATHAVHSATDGVNVTVPGFAPLGTRAEVTISGTNAHGVVFTNRDPIVIDPVLSRSSRPFPEFMRADRGRVELALAPGSAPSGRNLVVFDLYVPWPPMTVAGATTVDLSAPAEFNVPFDTYVKANGALERRRNLEIFGYTPGNTGEPFETYAFTTEDSYLARVTTSILSARANPGNPSHALVQLTADGTYMPPNNFPLVVYTPAGAVLASYDAIHQTPPYWWNVPSTDPLLTTIAPNDAGVLVFAANGAEFPASPDGILFFVVEPAVPGAVIKRSYCFHDRGRVVRRATTRSCSNTTDCRYPTYPSDFAICGTSGVCEDFDATLLNQSDGYCSNHGNPLLITTCLQHPDGCGPGERCESGVCTP